MPELIDIKELVDSIFESQFEKNVIYASLIALPSGFTFFGFVTVWVLSKGGI